MIDAELKKLQVKQARRRVADMDAHDGYSDRQLRTIFSALECGIKLSSGALDSAVFDALIMLSELSGYDDFEGKWP